MEREKAEWSRRKYYEDISRALDTGQLAFVLQFGEGPDVQDGNLKEREAAGKRKVEELLQAHGCSTEKTRHELERYGEILRSIYFKTGLQAGICLQAELLSGKK